MGEKKFEFSRFEETPEETGFSAGRVKTSALPNGATFLWVR